LVAIRSISFKKLSNRRSTSIRISKSEAPSAVKKRGGKGGKKREGGDIQTRFLFHANLLPPQHLLHPAVLPKRLHVLGTADDNPGHLRCLAHSRIRCARILLCVLRASAKSLKGTAPPIPRAYGKLWESRKGTARSRIGGFLDRRSAKAPFEVLLYTAQRCEAQAQKAVPFGERERGRVKRGSVRESLADEVE
jgi:hypothetical protein